MNHQVNGVAECKEPENPATDRKPILYKWDHTALVTTDICTHSLATTLVTLQIQSVISSSAAACSFFSH